MYSTDELTPYNPSVDLDRRKSIAQIPFIIAIPSLFIAVILWFLNPLPKEYNAIVFGIFGAILVFDIPVCVMVLFQWASAGEPPGLSFSPLIPTYEQREYRRILRDRPKLNDDEFYNTFYAESGIPKQLTVQLRRSLEDCYGLDSAGLHPRDNLIYADDEIDFHDVIIRIKREYEIEIPDRRMSKAEATYDFLLQCISEYSQNVNRWCPRKRFWPAGKTLTKESLNSLF